MKSSIGLYYQLTVKDKNGKVVRKTRLRKSKSFVLQFLQLCEAQMFPTVDVTIQDVDGTPQSVAENGNNLCTECAATVVTHGIIVGTGTTAPTNTDHTIETAIAHGGGAGQLNYGTTDKVAAAEVGANVDLKVIRTLTNSSGGTINVTEAGIRMIGSAAWNFLAVRDTFTAVPVTDAQTLTVTYTFRTTV